MEEKSREQQILDFAAAEGMFRERLSTLGNLAKALDATTIQANVLRWIYDEGGTHRPVEIVLSRIGGSPWVLAAENTVRKSIVFWEHSGIIEVERDRRDAGKQAPNTAFIRWSYVLQRLLGETRYAASSPVECEVAAGRIGLAADRQEGYVPSDDQRFFNGQHGAQGPIGARTASTLERTASTLERSDYAPCSLKTPIEPGLRNPLRALACARSLSYLSSFLSVIDDDSQERKVEFAQVHAWADEARRPLYPANWPKDGNCQKAFYEASILASMLFSKRWLLSATEATARVPRKADAPIWRYWIGCLRNGLVEIEGLPRMGSQGETRAYYVSYYASLTAAVEPAVLALLADCPKPSPPIRTADDASRPSRPPSEEDLRKAEEFRALLERRQQARRNPPPT
jgi:hypothetical protein